MLRQVKQNRAVIGAEGSDEVTLLTHLRRLYGAQNDPTNPKLFDCGGSTPKNAIRTMRQSIAGLGAYKKRLILLDRDRNADKISAGEKEAAKKPTIHIIFANIRFESEMLQIAGVPQAIISKCNGSNAEIAKEEFAKICDGTITGTGKSYDKVFPKKLLDEKRKSNKWLDRIIREIESSD